MCSFSSLPTEIIIRVLSFLPYKDLVICTGVTKQLRDIIDESATLEYILELGIAGLEDASNLVSPSVDRKNHRLAIADLLRALREREHAWSTLCYSSSWTIPVGKRYIAWELCGPVFAGCYLSGPAPPLHGIAFNKIDVFNVRDRSAGGATVNLTLEKSFYNFSIDPGQDLLIVVEEGAPLALVWKLHIRSLSSGLPYNQAYPVSHSELKLRAAKLKHQEHNYHVVHVPVAHQDWLNENGYPGATDIQILGDVVLFSQRRGPGGSGSIAVSNWKASEIIFITYPSCGDWCCTLLSQNELLIAGRASYRQAPSLEYYTFDNDIRSQSYPSSTSSKWKSPRVVFELPFVNDDADSGVRGTWRPASCYTQASFTPKSFSPFVSSTSSNPPLFFYPSSPQLIAIRFIDTSVAGPPSRSRKRTKIDMFIHVGHLRKLKNAHTQQRAEGDGTLDTTSPMPWINWGPTTTRILSAVLPKCWQRNIRGYRVLLLGAGSNSDNNGMSRGDMVLDFNSDLWDKSADVIWHQSNIVLGEDGSEHHPRLLRKIGTITTSLPYRQIMAPRFAPYMRDGIVNPDYAMLGDNIVYAEMDRTELGSLKAFRILHFENQNFARPSFD